MRGRSDKCNGRIFLDCLIAKPVRVCSVQAMLQVRSLRHLLGLVQLLELVLKPRAYIK